MKMSFQLLVIILLCTHLVNAQSFDPVGIKKEYYPVPSSPNVAAFEKYGDIPVNHNTGIPNIGIPIYAINLNGFSWPINLSYHASGFKSSDVATRNGLGWTLQATGIVSGKAPGFGTEEVLDRTLDLSYSSSGTSECIPASQLDINHAEGILAGTYSPAPIIYSVNAGALNGKFFFGPDKIGFLPAKDYKIQLAGTGSYGNLFIVYDEGGNRYEFLTDGFNSRTSMCNGVSTGAPTAVSYLTKIITAKGEQIIFTYDTEEYEYDQAQTHVKKIRDGGQINNCVSVYSGDEYYCDNTYSTAEKRLKKISGSNGALIYFSYSSRTDLPGCSKMDQIDIWYKSGSDSTLRKRVNFEYSYFGTGSDPEDLQLKLNEVIIKGNTGEELSSYILTYNNTAPPNKLYDDINFNGANVAETYNISKAAILEKIEYPTGGSTSFDYEVLTGFGVLRVTSIVDSANGKQTGYRKFEYNDSPNSNITGVNFLEYEEIYYFGNGNGTPPNCTNDAPCASPFDWLQSCTGTIWRNTPVIYPGHEWGDPTIRFTYVTEKFGSGGENGKIEYLFGLPTMSRNHYDLYYISAEYLLQKKVYRKNPDNSYTMLSNTTNAYETPSSSNNFFGGPQHAKEERTWAKNIFVLRPEMLLDCCDQFGSKYCFEKQYQQIDRRLSSVPVYLTASKQVEYSGADSITSQTNYYYEDPAYLQASRIETTNSKGQQLRARLKFPYHFSGTAVYDTMVVRNKISLPVENIDTNLTLNKEIARMKSNFQLWESNLLAEPVTIQHSISGNTLSTELTINGYDSKANIRQMTGKDELSTSFIWDYNGKYLIAEVVKADTSSVAATSFEADGKGGWTYSGSTNNTYSITGSKSYLASGGNITKSGLASATYIVSYWGRSGSVNVNSAGPTKTGKTIGSWTYYEHEVTTTYITISGSNYIDELRLYPKGALMKTITYTPLVGITSECDATNRIIYYEYDSFNRLKTVKDEDGKILKRYDYKYQQTYQD